MKFKIGYIALLLSIPAFIPQVIKLYKDNETGAFSSRSILLYTMAQIFWMLHGISIKDNSIIIASIINLLCFSYIMYKCIINDDFDPFDH